MSAEEAPLRPSRPAGKIIVAIDGPAGAGKSTVARCVARHFGLLNIESGAMYRALALKALRAGVPLNESQGLEALAAQTTILLEPTDWDNRVLLDGEDVQRAIAGLNGQALDGRPLTVNEARPPRTDFARPRGGGGGGGRDNFSRRRDY